MPCFLPYTFSFQSALPRGERRFSKTVITSYPVFQSALPRGERRFLNISFLFAVLFQSALPRGERRIRYRSSISFLYFNPRSHEGSDPKRLFGLISVGSISIRAPTRGATFTKTTFPITIPDFNPRSHEGSDAVKAATKNAIKISIRAPTRGATALPYPQSNNLRISIRAPTRGATLIDLIL